MAFDVSKFLALTALIAGTGAACSSTDDTTEPGGAGTSGSAGQSSAGKSGNQGGAAEAGSGGAAAGSAGADEGGGAGAGGVGAAAGAGGESVGGGGGAGGAGGAPDVGECLGSLAEGGAGGADSGVEPSLEGLCMDFFDVTCAASPEDYAPSYTVCEGVKKRAQPAVAVAVADCITALSVTDECDAAKVAACFTSLEGQGCPNAEAPTACETIKALENCDDVDLASCEKIANLVEPDMYEGFSGCMDPNNEGWFEPEFTGTCVERLDFCAGVRLF